MAERLVGADAARRDCRGARLPRSRSSPPAAARATRRRRRASASAEWADGFCGALTEWKSSLESVGSTLKNVDELSKDKIEEAADDVSDANHKLADDVDALGEPPHEAASTAKDTVDDLRDELKTSADQIDAGDAGPLEPDGRPQGREHDERRPADDVERHLGDGDDARVRRRRRRVEAGVRTTRTRASRWGRAERLPAAQAAASSAAASARSSVGIIVATFAFFLPTIADYGDVWDVVQAALVGVGARAPRGDRGQHRHVRAAVAGRAARARVLPRDPDDAGVDRARDRRAGRGRRRRRGLLRHDAPLGLPSQRRRPRGHADEPLEPAPQPLVPDRRRVPAHDHAASRPRRSRPSRSSASRSSASSSPGSCSSSSAIGSPTTSATSPRASSNWALAQDPARPRRVERAQLRGVPRQRRAASSRGRWPALTLASLAGSLSVFAVLARLAAGARRPGVGGVARRGVRRLGARPHHHARSRSRPAGSASSSSA